MRANNKYQMPQIMAPTQTDKKSMSGIGNYMDKQSRQMKNAISELSARLGALERENSALRERVKRIEVNASGK